MVGRALGHHVRIVIPENVFPEIPRTLVAYGAEIHWVPGELGVKRAIDVAREIAAGRRLVHARPVRRRRKPPRPLRRHRPRDPRRHSAGRYVRRRPRHRRHPDGRRPSPQRSEPADAASSPSSRTPATRSRACRASPTGSSRRCSTTACSTARSSSAAATPSRRRRPHAARGDLRRRLLRRRPPRRDEGHRAPARGNVVLLFADSGWKYLTTQMWTSAPDVHEDEELDEVVWW